MAKTQKPVPLASMRLAQAAYLAGLGHSAAEIGAATGMKTGHVYWLLFTHHIRLAPKTAADVVLPPIMVSRKTMGDVEHLSKTLALPPDWMLARLL
ncbi:MAG: hypothetical protein ACR652_15265, partial [Methylocystis sp.]|uniref:hypothetical protein n=1 Tax=Methylocystis sp. TaxID=1911079 RepID=UPI003DA293D0